MTEDTFLYLWEQGIVKAAKDVVAEISPDLIEKYNVKLNTRFISAVWYNRYIRK